MDRTAITTFGLRCFMGGMLAPVVIYLVPTWLALALVAPATLAVFAAIKASARHLSDG